MNLQEWIYNKIYNAVDDWMGDKYATQEAVENFWKEVLEQQIPFEKLDEHLRNYCNALYEFWSEEEE